MAAAIHNITIEQGATFVFNLTWKDSLGSPVDLTGYKARMQVRTKHSAPVALLDLSTDEGSITLGGATGQINCRAEATETTGMPAKTGVYDLELEDITGFVTRLVEGEATITPEVTRA